VFCRVAGAIRFMPALGEATYPMKIKVSFCLAISALIYPIVLESVILSEQPLILLSSMVKEAFIGVFIGLTVKITFHAMHMAAVFIATQSGLAFATMYDPSQREQTTTVTSLLSIMVLSAIFVSDTHHLFIKVIVGSYNIFSPKMILNMSDFSASIISTVTTSLQTSLRIAAPYFIIHLLITICNGILSRLMPSFQVFFVMTPLQVLITYFILYITLNSTLTIQIEAIEKALLNIL
jgi:flagellar biosynthetic protein FliR